MKRERPMNYTNVIERIPAGKHGVAEVIHDTPDPFERLRGALHGQPLNRETYVRLLVRNQIMMTDAEFERRTNAWPLLKAKGDALIAGLGLGLILDPLIERCKTVTVIEKEPDVIALVAHAFPNVKIIKGDILRWQPRKKKFDFIYFDIWGEFSSDDLKIANRLEGRYKPSLRRGGYMQSWVRIALEQFRGC